MYYFCTSKNETERIHARVAELVDALDSKSCAFGRAGSIPAPGTKDNQKWLSFFCLYNSG
jgi:hypothetical protein